MKVHHDIVHTGTLQADNHKMTMDENAVAHLMSVLTDLYADPEMAVIREYATNALDSHIAAGVTSPIIISTPSSLNPTFHVEDTGLGMSLATILDQFSKYGYSSKRDTDDAVGMLGLGCKSGLAYTSQFTLVSRFDGLEVTALVTRDSDGAGAIQVVQEVDTSEPNGVHVSIPVKNVTSFNEKIKRFFRFWNPGTVLVDGKEPYSIWSDPNLLHLDEDVVAIELDQNQSRDDFEDFVVMGGVAYPVKTRDNTKPEDYARSGRRPNYGGGSLLIGHQHSEKWDRYIDSSIERMRVRIVARVPIGSVNFTPSREQLTMSKRTREVLNTIDEFATDRLAATALQQVADQPTAAKAVRVARRWRKVLPHTKFRWDHQRVRDVFDFEASDERIAKWHEEIAAWEIECAEARARNDAAQQEYYDCMFNEDPVRYASFEARARNDAAQQEYYDCMRNEDPVRYASFERQAKKLAAGREGREFKPTSLAGPRYAIHLDGGSLISSQMFDHVLTQPFSVNAGTVTINQVSNRNLVSMPPVIAGSTVTWNLYDPWVEVHTLHSTSGTHPVTMYPIIHSAGADSIHATEAGRTFTFNYDDQGHLSPKYRPLPPAPRPPMPNAFAWNIFGSDQMHEVSTLQWDEAWGENLGGNRWTNVLHVIGFDGTRVPTKLRKQTRLYVDNLFKDKHYASLMVFFYAKPIGRPWLNGIREVPLSVIEAIELPSPPPTVDASGFIAVPPARAKRGEAAWDCEVFGPENRYSCTYKFKGTEFQLPAKKRFIAPLMKRTDKCLWFPLSWRGRVKEIAAYARSHHGMSFTLHAEKSNEKRIKRAFPNVIDGPKWVLGQINRLMIELHPAAAAAILEERAASAAGIHKFEGLSDKVDDPKLRDLIERYGAENPQVQEFRLLNSALNGLYNLERRIGRTRRVKRAMSDLTWVQHEYPLIATFLAVRGVAFTYVHAGLAAKKGDSKIVGIMELIDYINARYWYKVHQTSYDPNDHLYHPANCVYTGV